MNASFVQLDTGNSNFLDHTFRTKEGMNITFIESVDQWIKSIWVVIVSFIQIDTDSDSFVDHTFWKTEGMIVKAVGVMDG